MNSWRWFGGALLTVAVVSSGAMVYGQGDKGDKGDKKGGDNKGEKLEWKGFEKGKSFYQEMTTETVQDMTVQNQSVKQKQKQTFWIKWDTLDANDKTYVVEQTILGVKMDIEIGGNKIVYDSTAKEGTQPQNPLTDFFKALVGAKFKLTIDKNDLKVTNIEGRSEFISKLSKANPQLEPLLNAILSEQALKQMADPTFAAIPEKGEVPANKTWKRTTKLDMGPIGIYDTTYTYTAEALKDKMIPIKVDTSLVYKAPAVPVKGDTGLPFTIGSGSSLKTEESKGQILFDPEKGRIQKSDLQLKLSGDLTINIGGMTTDVKLQQSQTTNMTTSDTMPAVLEKKS